MGEIQFRPLILCDEGLLESLSIAQYEELSLLLYRLYQKNYAFSLYSKKTKEELALAMHRLSIHVPCICEGGAQFILNRTCISEYTFSAHEKKNILTWLKEHHIPYAAVQDDDLFIRDTWSSHTFHIAHEASKRKQFISGELPLIERNIYKLLLPFDTHELAKMKLQFPELSYFVRDDNISIIPASAALICVIHDLADMLMLKESDVVLIGKSVIMDASIHCIQVEHFDELLEVLKHMLT